MKIIVFVLLISSCSHYINRIHKNLDNSISRKKRVKNNKFSYLQNHSPYKKRKLSSKTHPVVHPKVKRKYGVKKRYRKEDLRDDSYNGSLWASDKGNNFLFDDKIKKKKGDIIEIEVQEKLKEEIITELKLHEKRYLPPEEKKNEKEKSKSSSKESFTDKIVSILIEEINKNHVLLKGRKNLLYKGRKKMIELQALVARRHISTEGLLSSDHILESNIAIIR